MVTPFSFKKIRKSYGKIISLESLPNDLLVEISSYVGSSSLTDVRSFRQVSKSIRPLCDEQYVISNLSLQEVPIFPWFHDIERFSNFLKRCRRNGNPEALYRKGFVNYFQNNREDKGLQQLEKAAKKGNQDAKYIYGIILICLGDQTRQKGFETLSSLHKPLMSSTMEYLEKTRLKIRDLIWWRGRPTMRKLKNSYVEENCKCNGETTSFLVRNCVWHRYGAENDMTLSSACEVCLWQQEIRLFLKDIEV